MAVVTTGRSASLKSRLASSKRPATKFVRNRRAVVSIGDWNFGFGPAAKSVVNKREALFFTPRIFPAGPLRHRAGWSLQYHCGGRGGGGPRRIMAVVRSVSRSAMRFSGGIFGACSITAFLNAATVGYVAANVSFPLL